MDWLLNRIYGKVSNLPLFAEMRPFDTRDPHKRDRYADRLKAEAKQTKAATSGSWTSDKPVKGERQNYVGAFVAATVDETLLEHAYSRNSSHNADSEGIILERVFRALPDTVIKDREAWKRAQDLLSRRTIHKALLPRLFSENLVAEVEAFQQREAKAREAEARARELERQRKAEQERAAKVAQAAEMERRKAAMALAEVEVKATRAKYEAEIAEKMRIFATSRNDRERYEASVAAGNLERMIPYMIQSIYKRHGL